jgi:transcriptional regulator with XRE-family HTH domain
LSRSELAKRVGVSQNTVTSWTTGRYTPGHRNLSSIATVLGMTLDQLHGVHVSRMPSPPTGPRPAGDIEPAEAQRLVAEIASIDLAASLQALQRATPDLMRVLARARALASKQSHPFP